MKSLTHPILWIGTLLLAVVAGTGIYWQRISSLRGENQALELQLQGAWQFSAEGRSIGELRSENAEVHRLKTETRDLHRVRNQVRQLREQTKDLDTLRTKNERLHAAVAKLEEPPAAASSTQRPAFILGQLQFSGYATPEATLITMFWAMKQGDLATAARCWSSDEAGKWFGGTKPEEFRRQGEAMSKQFGELRIAAKKIVSAQEVILGIQMFSKGNNKPDEIGMPFKLIGDEWKLSAPSP